jgi:hypothetical protein
MDFISSNNSEHPLGRQDGRIRTVVFLVSGQTFENIVSDLVIDQVNWLEYVRNFFQLVKIVKSQIDFDYCL